MPPSRPPRKLLFILQNPVQLLLLREAFPDPTMPAKSLQSCPILCDPVDCSPPSFSIRGVFQARRLAWAAISFSVVKVNPSAQHLHFNIRLTCSSYCSSSISNPDPCPNGCLWGFPSPLVRPSLGFIEPLILRTWHSVWHRLTWKEEKAGRKKGTKGRLGVGVKEWQAGMPAPSEHTRAGGRGL